MRPPGNAGHESKALHPSSSTLGAGHAADSPWPVAQSNCRGEALIGSREKCGDGVAGPTFYQLHLLFDKHFNEHVKLVDSIAERIQVLGGVSIAMAPDVAETTHIERPPWEEVPVQLSRLLDAHQPIIGQTRKLARRAAELGDDGTNDLLVSEVLRTNELQVWFLSEHLVDVPLITATL
jgi:DNA-binding ferritin-like protein